MKKTIIFVLCTLFIAASANAVTKVYGPFPNYKGVVNESTGFFIPGICDCSIYNPITGKDVKLFGRESQEVEVFYQTPVFENTYHQIELPFDPETAMMIITAIITKDLDPGLDPNEIPDTTGFDPDDPELEPKGDGYFEGISGTIYTGITETCTIGDLPARLPDYDINNITGSLDSIVYILQGEVPAEDFVCAPFEFSFDYLGYAEYGEPNWVGDPNPDYPYQHSWQLNITKWNNCVPMVDDIHIVAPQITPGYVYIEPKPDSPWVAGPWLIGRYGYESNPGDEFVSEASMPFYVEGKTPVVAPGHVYLTNNQVAVSHMSSTLVVASKPNSCGDWGYLEADLDEDCDVDFGDLAYHALKWLHCTDPEGADCYHENIIGVGFVFDGEDYDNPATIAFLHEYSTADEILEPNDIIVEYRGYQVTSGAQLSTLIDDLEDLNDGDPVPMTVIKESTGMSKRVELIAQEIEVISERDSSTSKKCIKQKLTPSGKNTCRCVSGDKICACGWEAKKEKNKKSMKIRWHCADTSKKVCHGDWLTVK